MKKFLIAAAFVLSAAVSNAQTIQKLVSTKDINVSNRMFFDGAWRYRWMNNSIVKGGVVTWVSGLTFAVTSATYTINGKEYSSASGQITLNASDPSNPRFDVIALNTSGQIVKITGTPSAVPAVPQVTQSSQVYLTSILIPAGATTPGGISSVTVYDENIEWSHTQADFPAGISFTSTTSPYTGTKGINVTGSISSDVSASGGLKFFDGGTYNYYDFSVIRFYIKLKAALPSTALLQVALGNGNEQLTTIGSAYGFNPSLVGTYQNISIPMSDINKLSTTFTTLYIMINGTGIGYYIDNIQLQSGIGGGLGSGYLTDWYIKSGTDSAFVVINGMPQFRNTITSGGGGGGLNFYDYSGSISSNRTVTSSNNNLLFWVSAASGSQLRTWMQASNSSNSLSATDFSNTTLNQAYMTPYFGSLTSHDGGSNIGSRFITKTTSLGVESDSVFLRHRPSNYTTIFNTTPYQRSKNDSTGYNFLMQRSSDGFLVNYTGNFSWLAKPADIAKALNDSALEVTRPITPGDVKLFEAISSTKLQISDAKDATDNRWVKNPDSTISLITLTKAQADSIAKKNLSDSAFEVVRPVTNGTVSMFSKISSTKLQISDILNSYSIAAVKNADSTVSLFVVANKQTISTGTATTISNGIQTVYIDPATLLATHTITMPAAPYDQQVITFIAGGTVAAGATVVTTFSFAANSGQTLYQAITPTIAKGGDTFTWQFNSTTSRWTRL